MYACVYACTFAYSLTVYSKLYKLGDLNVIFDNACIERCISSNLIGVYYNVYGYYSWDLLLPNVKHLLVHFVKKKT